MMLSAVKDPMPLVELGMMYSHRKAALVGGAGGPRMLDVYRVGPVRTAARGWPWWLLSRFLA